MKNIVFDMDGVIFDTEKIWVEAYKKASKKFNQNFDETLRKQVCGMNNNEINKIFAEKFPEIDALQVRKFMTDYVQKTIQKQGVQLKDGFVELIHFLKTKKFKLALATGSELEVVENYFEQVGLKVNEIFDAVIAGNMVEKSKPAPEIYVSACNKLGVNSHGCIAIEDSPNGVVSASKAGLDVLFVIDQIEPDEQINKHAKHIFNNLFEVKDYLSKN